MTLVKFGGILVLACIQTVAKVVDPGGSEGYRFPFGFRHALKAAISAGEKVEIKG